MRIIQLQLEIVITTTKAELLHRLPIQVIQAVVISRIHRRIILLPALVVTAMGKLVVGLPNLLNDTNHREATVSALCTLNLRLPLTCIATKTLTSELLTPLVRRPGNDEKSDQINFAIYSQTRIPRISIPKLPPLFPIALMCRRR